MKDIKELALETLDAMAEDGLQVHNITYESGNTGVELDEPALDEFATRFLAAYLAEQEPVAIIGMDYTGAYILHGAPNNLQQGTKLFTAPLEPAPKETALSMYKRFEVEYETADPVERLRAFCSFALDGQDWLDVEPFFDALTERLAARVPDGCVVVPRDADERMKAFFYAGIDFYDGYRAMIAAGEVSNGS